MMNYSIFTKSEILDCISSLCNEYNGILESISEENMHERIPGKWSIANNIEHLINTNAATTLAFKMPKAVLKVSFGKHEGASRDLKPLISQYQLAISSGSGSPFLYNPKVPFVTKNMLKKGFNLSVDALTNSMEDWTEADLDIYQIPHPILGKITAREMLGFTAYHLYHHLNTVKALTIYAGV